MKLEDFLNILLPNQKLDLNEEELEILENLFENIKVNIPQNNSSKNEFKEENKINRNDEIKQIIESLKKYPRHS